MSTTELSIRISRRVEGLCLEATEVAAAKQVLDFIRDITGDLQAFCRERVSRNQYWGDAAADMNDINAAVHDGHLNLNWIEEGHS